MKTVKRIFEILGVDRLIILLNLIRYQFSTIRGKYAACRAIGRTASPAAVRPLFNIAKRGFIKHDRNIWKPANEALKILLYDLEKRNIRKPALRKMLIENLNRDWKSLRETEDIPALAARVLGKLGDPNALEALFKNSQSGYLVSAGSAREAIGEILRNLHRREDIEYVLKNFANRIEGYQVIGLIKRLAEFKNPKSIPVLESLEHKDMRVAPQIRQAIDTIRT